MDRSSFLAATLLACLPLVSHADSGWFVGIDAGRSEADAAIKDSFLVGSVTAEDTGTSSGIRLRGGYQFGRYFALELSFTDFGDLEYSFDPDDCPGEVRSCPFSISTEFRAFSLSMVGILPLGDRWFLNARAGLSELRATSRQLDSADVKESTDEAGLQVGVGVGLNLDENWQFLLSYSTIESLDFGLGSNSSGSFGVYDAGDTTLASIGVNYHW